MSNSTSTNLATHHCVPCEGGTKPLTREEFSVYLDQVKEWQVINDHQLEREFVLKNFSAALQFINKIGEIAESEGHHPNIYLHDYKKVKIELYTHAIDGLSVNDFIIATRVDEVFNPA